MQTGTGHSANRGLVVSDLHLLSRRSRGADCVDRMWAELATAEILVLNGDIFDFRWSTLRGLGRSVAAALQWLGELSNAFPKCRIHYVLGNHDCCSAFRNGLDALASTLPGFQWHEHNLQLGSALFLHGDCADQEMDLPALRRYRERWEDDRQRGALSAVAYMAVDRLGFTRLALARNYPRDRTVRRIAHHLDQASPGWRQTICDCYFGHTHLPFSDYRHNGVRFHNTGSAIRGMAFNPLSFELPRHAAATADASSHHGCTD